MKSISSWKWLHLYVHGGSALKKPHEERSLLWGILLSVLWFIWDNIWKVASLTVCVVDGEASMEGNTNTAQRKMENTCKRKRCLHYVQRKTLNSCSNAVFITSHSTRWLVISVVQKMNTRQLPHRLFHALSLVLVTFIFLSRVGNMRPLTERKHHEQTESWSSQQHSEELPSLTCVKQRSHHLGRAAHDSSVLTWPSLFQIDDLTLSVSSRFVHSVCCHCVVYSLDGNEYGS